MAPHRARPVDAGGFAVQPAMRVNDQPLRSGRAAAEPRVGQHAGLVQQRPVDLVLGQVALDAAVVAEDQAVPVGLFVAPPAAGRRRGPARLAASGRQPADDDAGHAERGDPGVHRVAQPVGVAQHREAAASPAAAPGVLHDEAVGVEADQREGVAAGARRPAVERDHRQVGVAGRRLRIGRHVLPAGMRPGRHVDRADFVDRCLQVGDRLHIDAEIDAQRVPRRPLGPAEARRRRLARPVGPVLLEADAVLVPALQRAAAARPLVVLAGVLVVAAREVVQHARADRSHLLRRAGLAPAQIIDDAGQSEAGAGPFLALVEDQPGPGVGAQPGLDVGGGRVFVGQRCGRRQVGTVAQVARVLAGSQLAPGRHCFGRNGGRPLAAAGGCRRPQSGSALEHVAETVQAVRTAIDQAARLGQIAGGERLAHRRRLVGQEGGEQRGGHLRGVGQIGRFLEVDPDALPVGPVIGPPGQLDEAAPAIARAVAGLDIAQVLAAVVRGIRCTARRRVELRAVFGDRHEALGFGTDRRQRGAQHRAVGQAGGTQRGQHVGQITGQVGRLGRREQPAHRGDVDRQFGRRPRVEPEHVAATRADDAVGDHADARLPAADRRLGVGVELRAAAQSGVIGGRPAQFAAQALLQRRDPFALLAPEQQHVHDRLLPASGDRPVAREGRARFPAEAAPGHAVVNLGDRRHK